MRNPGCIGKPGAFANDGGSLSHASYAARSAPPGRTSTILPSYAFGNIPAQHVLHVITPVRVVLSRACRGLFGNRLILTRVKTLTVVLIFAGSVFDVDSFGDAFIALLSRAVIERDRLVCCGGVRRRRSRRRSIWRRRVRRDIFACRRQLRRWILHFGCWLQPRRRRGYAAGSRASHAIGVFGRRPSSRRSNPGGGSLSSACFAAIPVASDDDTAAYACATHDRGQTRAMLLLHVGFGRVVGDIGDLRVELCVLLIDRVLVSSVISAKFVAPAPRLKTNMPLLIVAARREVR